MPYDDNCHEEQIIYVYNIKDLIENARNVQHDVLSFRVHGKNWIQNLAAFDQDNLLVTADKCEDNRNTSTIKINAILP